MKEAPSELFEEIASALRANEARNKMAESYSTLLRDNVFCCTPEDYSRKDLAKFRRALDNARAHSVLVPIWKSSEFVPNSVRSAVGVSSVYGSEDLTSYGLAKRMAGSIEDVAKVNFRIRNIGLAAAAYGLIERFPKHKTCVFLKATVLLNEFMTGLAQRDRDIFARTFRRAHEGR